MEKTYVIGIDLGGTNTELGLVRSDGHIVARTILSTAKYTDFPTFADDMVKAAGELCAAGDPETGWQGTVNDLQGFGIGAPNADPTRGCMVEPPNLKQFKGVSNFVEEFRRLGVTVPVAVDNDANAAAVGEMVYGGAQGMQHFIMITLGTGVGSGIVVDGKLVHGSTGTAGELGHNILIPNGRKCSCGRYGCLETYTSARGIVQTFIEVRREMDTPADVDEHPGWIGSEVTDAEVHSITVGIASNAGDPRAIETFRRVGYWLGIACANAVTFSAPECIFLMGGPTKVGEPLLAPLRKSFEEHLLNIYQGSCRIEMSKLKTNEVAILGAAALVN